MSSSFLLILASSRETPAAPGPAALLRACLPGARFRRRVCWRLGPPVPFLFLLFLARAGATDAVFLRTGEEDVPGEYE